MDLNRKVLSWLIGKETVGLIYQHFLQTKLCFTGQLAIQWWLRMERAGSATEGQKGRLVAMAPLFNEVILPQHCTAVPVLTASSQRAPDAIDLIDQNGIGLDSLFFPSD